MRITLGSTWTEPIFAQLGVVDSAHMFGGYWHNWFSAIAPMHSTVLRSSWGDLVLAATTCLPTPTHGAPPPDASIHFGTTPNPPPATDTTVEQPWDKERMTLWYDGKAAIGTQGALAATIFGDSGHTGEYDLLHLHVPCVPTTYTIDPSSGYDSNQLAVVKLSYGNIHGADIRSMELGFERGHQLASFASNEDLVYSTNSDAGAGPTGSGVGDMIFSNRRIGRAIRFGTTYDSDNYPSPDIDQERLAILGNGNVGIDIPKDSITGKCIPLDQVQIGGGVVPLPGNAHPMAPLTIYGGWPKENMPEPDSGIYPGGGWRYISFNHWYDHIGRTGSHRFDSIGSSAVNFSDDLLDFSVWPYDSTRGLNDFSKATEMQLIGNLGLQLWFMDTTSNPFHHLLDIFLPGQPSGIRNTNGLSYFHTPVCISSDHPGDALINFDSLTNVNPDIGDGKTWMLAVNGAALFKEIFVLDSTWADYAFLPGYKPMPISEVENFTAQNHHLPDIPSQQAMHGAVDVAKTTEALTHQLEDEMLYIEQLSKQNEKLTAAVQELKAEVAALKSSGTVSVPAAGRQGDPATTTEGGNQ